MTGYYRKRIVVFAAALLAFFVFAAAVPAQEIIGYSVEERPIKVETVGDEAGTRNLVVVGGIHGGYEWNSVVLAQGLLKHYSDNPDLLPKNFKLHIIQVMNPDGLHRIAGTADPELLDPVSLRLTRSELLPGRLNGNLVDLNRNFDSDWRSVSNHGSREVNAGTAPFSKPESRAVRDYIKKINPLAVLFIHSASNKIWYGGLPDNWAPARKLAEAYSKASGYAIHQWTGGGTRTYSITGTASGYYYKQGIPAVTIELSGRYSPNLERNKKGLNALIEALLSSD
jgi:predicted deacylase